MQEALKNDAIKEDFETIVKQLLDFTTQPTRVAYDMRMTKMLDDIDLNEQNEVIRMTRYSTFDLDDEVFYTPGSEKEVKEFKPVEIEI